MMFEKVIGILYLVFAVVSIVGVILFWNTQDAGFIRYGVVLPVWFIYKGISSLNKASELKKEVQNAITKHTQGN
jgi:hypothetical protein